MTPEEYSAIVDEVEAEQEGNFPLSEPGTFVKPIVKYSEERVCKCGNKYTLKTPYDLCQPGNRDRCDECLSKLSAGDP